MKYSIGIILLILTGCVNETPTKDSPKVIIDPNTTSEMAQQMREMTKELEAIKIKLEKNETLGENLLNFELIHQQQVTDSSFNKPHIEPMSIAYDYAVGEFNKDPSIKNYSSIINNCSSCHQLSCQGPLVKINKLMIKSL
jgi:PBP1b-binding outer membrane lipoprotein LpoB